MSRTSTASRRASLGATLERDRLHDRAARLDRVVAALRARARVYEQVPPGLAHSLAEFQRERDAVRARITGTGVVPDGRPAA